MEITKTLKAKSCEEWRKWLEKHHDKEDEIWLVFLKKHTGKRAISYSEAVEEALCFGWIDGIAKRIDEDKYAQRFTPRKNNLNWSELNKSRVKKLIENGKMTDAGLKKVTFSLDEAPKKEEIKRITPDVPGKLQEALDKNKIASDYFNSLAPSYRKMFLLWINSAKREETKLKRIDEAINLLTQNKKLGLK